MAGMQMANGSPRLPQVADCLTMNKQPRPSTRIDHIQMVSGHSSPSKVVAIDGMDDEAIKKAFE